MRFAATVLAALALAAPAMAGLPQPGLLRPGQTLGGIAIGATAAKVRVAWGPSFGVCSACLERTWYFNAKPFEPQGAGVAFRGGRVAALFTLWSPPEWRTEGGLKLGDAVAKVTLAYGALPRTRCAGYSALTLARPGVPVVTDFYLLGAHLWGFGLRLRALKPCR
ncbi:MAG: hypothetical protein QOE36_152 [Gaiellaceae bacterium]|nr:hypothetical protein [Gaiellaceae bacterium]